MLPGTGKFSSYFLFIPIAFVILYLRETNDISHGGHPSELQFISLRLNKEKER